MALGCLTLLTAMLSLPLGLSAIWSEQYPLLTVLVLLVIGVFTLSVATACFFPKIRRHTLRIVAGLICGLSLIGVVSEIGLRLDRSREIRFLSVVVYSVVGVSAFWVSARARILRWGWRTQMFDDVYRPEERERQRLANEHQKR
jgi:hypothetical protein